MREGAFGGPTWNKEANQWNQCYRFDTPTNKFLISDEDINGAGKEPVKAVVNTSERDISAIAHAVCRVKVVGSSEMMSGFFFAPRKAITGILFKYREVLSRNDSTDVYYTFADIADEASFKCALWKKGKVVPRNLIEEHQIMIFESNEDHPFVPLDSISTSLEVGDLIACMGYNDRPETYEINNFWSQLSPDERQVVLNHTWRPTVVDVMLQIKPDLKIVSPGKVQEIISDPPITSAKVTCNLFFGSTCGPVIRLNHNGCPVVVGRVEGTIWTQHLNRVHLFDDDLLRKLATYI